MLHVVKNSCIRGLNADIRGVHSVEHGVHLLQSRHSLVLVILFEHTKVFLELCGVLLLIWEDLYIFVIEAQDHHLGSFDMLVEFTISVIVPNEF